MPRNFDEGAAFYYTSRGNTSRYDNRAVEWSQLELVKYNVPEIMRDMKKPYLVISGEKQYALFVTNPGWGEEYPQGLGNNLGESFPFEARKYDDRMIILSTQLMDWGQTSARDCLALIHHFLNHYAIDLDRVYLHGYSGGGETGSLMMEMEPELSAGVLFNSTKWDGNYTEIAKTRTPLRLSVGENDSYYGSEPLKQAYQGIHNAYEAEGLSEEEIDELLILDVKPHEWFTEHGYSDEHAGGNAFGEDEETMSWLFSQVRE